MREILSFPDHLRVVPQSPIAPDDPQMDDKRAEWRRWLEGVQRYRVDRRLQLRKQKKLWATERLYCQRDKAHFVNTWCFIYEPRPMKDRPPHVAFITLPFQIDFLDWIDSLEDEEGAKQDGVASKSREMGASWLCAVDALHGFLFLDNFQGRFVSWRADEVDAKNPDSIFWKIEYMMKRLPPEFLPHGWDWDKHRQKMLFENPENGNTLVGQASTERSMRGGRARRIYYDEAALNKAFEESWATTASVAPVRIAPSSEHLEFNDFFHKLTHGIDLEPDEQPSVFTMDYWLHFDHGVEWMENIRQRLASKPGAFEREVLRNPRGDDRVFVYPAAQEKIPFQIDSIPNAPIDCGLDPGSSDEFGVVWEEQHTDGRTKVMDAYQKKGRMADFHGTMLRGTPHICTALDLTDEQISWFDAGIVDMLPDSALPEGWERVGVDPDGDAGVWTYTQAEIQLMQWVRHRMPSPKEANYYGDISGRATLGASKDTVYRRLGRFGIRVNRDRTPTGQVTANRMEARTYQGRQAALKELLPRLDFNNSPGAVMALHALQNYRWGDEDSGKRHSEVRTPEHTRASHLATAQEYIAVQRYIRRKMKANPLPKPYKAGRRRVQAQVRDHG